MSAWPTLNGYKKTWGWGGKKCNIVLERAVAEHFICVIKRFTGNFFRIFFPLFRMSRECVANVFHNIYIKLQYPRLQYRQLYAVCLAKFEGLLKNMGGGIEKSVIWFWEGQWRSIYFVSEFNLWRPPVKRKKIVVM